MSVSSQGFAALLYRTATARVKSRGNLQEASAHPALLTQIKIVPRRVLDNFTTYGFTEYVHDSIEFMEESS